MRAKTPKIFCAARRRRAAPKKVISMGSECDFATSIFFSEKKPAGSSFHVYVKQAHARTGPVAVADLDKMLNKVPWLLGEVSL